MFQFNRDEISVRKCKFVFRATGASSKESGFDGCVCICL